MALEVKHKFVSAKVDSLDSSKIQPSNWNDDHDLLMDDGAVVGRANGAGAGAATEIPMGLTGEAILAAATQAAARTAVGADDSRTTILAAATKATPVDADQIPILDSAAANVYKRLTWGALKTALATTFNAIGGTVTALQNFVSSTTIAVLAATGVGTIYLRPNGPASTVGQTSIDATGAMAVSGGVTATSYKVGAFRVGGAPDVVLEDQKASGTTGGTGVASTWTKRDLNTEVRDVYGVCTLASNEFTMTVAGWVEWSSPVYATHLLTRLWNVTDNVLVAMGQAARADSGPSSADKSTGGGAVVAGKAYAIQYYMSNSGGNRLGLAGSQGIEVYTRVRFWRTD